MREVAPERVLDVGCGMGELAERVQKELGAEVVAVDISPRMVELTRARGIDARLADVQSFRSPTASSTASLRTGCSTTCPISIAA